MVIISKKQVPKCSQILIAQIQICGNQNVNVKSNYEPMVYTKNIKQLSVIQPLNKLDLEIVRQTLNKTENNYQQPISQEWPKDMLASKRHIKDFVEKNPRLGLEDAIKRNQRRSLGISNTAFDYKNKKSVNLIYNNPLV